MCVNNLLKVVTRKRSGRRSNPLPLSRKSSALTITPGRMQKQKSFIQFYRATVNLVNTSRVKEGIHLTFRTVLI